MYAGLSPYNYCLNNPVNVIDPDGGRPLAQFDMNLPANITALLSRTGGDPFAALDYSLAVQMYNKSIDDEERNAARERFNDDNSDNKSSQQTGTASPADNSTATTTADGNTAAASNGTTTADANNNGTGSTNNSTTGNGGSCHCPAPEPGGDKKDKKTDIPTIVSGGVKFVGGTFMIVGGIAMIIGTDGACTPIGMQLIGAGMTIWGVARLGSGLTEVAYGFDGKIAKIPAGPFEAWLGNEGKLVDHFASGYWTVSTVSTLGTGVSYMFGGKK